MDEWQAIGNVQSAATAEYGFGNITTAYISIFAIHHIFGVECAG